MTADELRAALAVAELEERLVAAKEDGTLTPELKLELREARRVYREMRAPASADPAPINVSAAPAPLEG